MRPLPYGQSRDRGGGGDLPPPRAEGSGLSENRADSSPMAVAPTAIRMQGVWSSYRAHVGVDAGPPWLATNELHDALTGQARRDPAQIELARRRYADWVSWCRASMAGHNNFGIEPIDR